MCINYIERRHTRARAHTAEKSGRRALLSADSWRRSHGGLKSGGGSAAAAAAAAAGAAARERSTSRGVRARAQNSSDGRECEKDRE